MTTLADITLKVASILRQVDGGIATSGSSNSLTDSALTSKAADYYNGGVLWWLSGALNGRSVDITDFSGSSGIFSFTAISGSSGSAGNIWRAAPPVYNRQALINAINMALAEIGPVYGIDDTTVTVADQEEYDLPSGVIQVLMVEVSSAITDPYDWEENRYWNQVGTKLIFKPGYAPATAAMLIRIHHTKAHAQVDDDTDTIDAMIDPERLAWTAAYYAAVGRMNLPGLDDPTLREMVNLCQSKAEQFRMLKPKRIPNPATRLARY